jgi:soluble lytic murein transglycosylase-like protein
MQLMPQTARGVTQHISPGLEMSDREKTYRLKDPQTNLEIAQHYIETLLKDRNVDGDILKLLVAYNAGPGNLSRWEKQWEGVKDPLLFIELIPSGETRNYVEKVIANYWMYRLREGRDIPTLEALAEGRPAKYAGDFERSIFQVAAR